MDSLISYGGKIKALGDGKVGGYGVTFGGKDLSGEWFTPTTYYGRHNGDGVDTIFHHGIPLKGVSPALADHIFTNAATAVKDERGIFVEAVLDMANEYENLVYELAAKGKLGWSSGAPSHMVKRLETGEITRWVIAEFSLTPTPAEPRNRIVPMKTLLIDAKSSGLSFESKRDLITRAICAQNLDGTGNSSEYCEAYIYDLYDTSVVYNHGAKMCESSYSLDGEKVTLGTPVEVRRVVAYRPMKTVREFEDHLRDLGYTNSQSVALASGGYKAAFPLRDSESDEEAIKSLVQQIEDDYLLLALTRF